MSSARIATVTTPVPTDTTGAHPPGRSTVWSDLDRPATGRRVAGTIPVMVTGTLVGLLAAAFVVPTGFNLAYSDAQSHLTIARRLLDTSSSPGIQQLGTVWLPVPHLALAPLVVVLWMWHTGWGAALLGSICLGVTVAGIYRAVARWGGRRTARLTAVGVVVVNPSMLYLCTTALTEPVLIASMAMCVAGLSNLATRKRLSSPGEVAIFCGIPAALAALSRYEGWALCLTGTIFVTVVAWRRPVSRMRHVLATVLGFVGPPLAAIAWWVGYNWVVFHDPVAFFSGQFSASAQQAQIVADGTSSKDSLGTTFAALNLAVESAVGLVAIAVAACGVIALARGRLRLERILLVAVAASSYLFLAVALYTGQAIIWNPAVRSGYAWNNRFAMASILPAALLASAAVQGAVDLGGRIRPGWARRGVRVVTPISVALLLAGQAIWGSSHLGWGLVEAAGDEEHA